MTLQSMTGFARTQGHAGEGSAGGNWTWEIRSVNARGLDIRVRLPQGLEALEPECRRAVSARLGRGNVQATLVFEGDTSGAVPIVNEAALDAVLAIAQRLRDRIGSPPPSAESILAIRGVLEFGETGAGDAEAAERNRAILSGLDAALAELVAARGAEGRAIAAAMADQLSEIRVLVARIKADPSHGAEAIRERLARQVGQLIEAGTGLDPNRLHQEAAILATKADISEEIDRLTAHLAAARDLLDTGGPVGRQLDFLAQEFNRECNTICSKAVGAAVTAAGLEMKVIIDRFREQVQNLE